MKKAILSVFILLFLSNALIHPHYQSYFNLIIGKNENAYKYLADSSLDWGQDLGYLADYLKKNGDPEIMLAYFGTSNPDYYGIRYQNLASNGLDMARYENLNRHINSDNPQKEYLAVSATCLAGVDYPDHSWFYFLYNRKPMAVLGNTIFVYDITRRIADYKAIAGIYLQNNLMTHFLRCGRVIYAIDNNDDFGKVCKSISLIEIENRMPDAFKIMSGLSAAEMQKSKDREFLLQASIIYATLLIKNKEYGGALKILDDLQAIRAEEINYKILNLRGVLFMRTGEYALAENNFAKAIEANPGYAVSYFNLSLIYEKQKRYLDAQKMLKRSIEIDPGYSPAVKKYTDYLRAFSVMPNQN